MTTAFSGQKQRPRTACLLEFGTKKAEHSIERESEAAVGETRKSQVLVADDGSTSSPNPSLGRDTRTVVYWPVGNQDWKPTTLGVQTSVNILRYRLYENSGVYSYVLEFTNNRHWLFHFWDQTNEVYEVETYRNGDHYLRYSSRSPAIHFVGIQW